MKQFKVTEPVSVELKEAIVAGVREQAKMKLTKYRGTAVGDVIVATASTADREATINAIKALVNENMLNINTARRPMFHPQVRKPFEQRKLRLLGPGYQLKTKMANKNKDK